MQLTVKKETLTRFLEEQSKFTGVPITGKLEVGVQYPIIWENRERNLVLNKKTREGFKIEIQDV